MWFILYLMIVNYLCMYKVFVLIVINNVLVVFKKFDFIYIFLFCFVFELLD